MCNKIPCKAFFSNPYPRRRMDLYNFVSFLMCSAWRKTQIFHADEKYIVPSQYMFHPFVEWISRKTVIFNESEWAMMIHLRCKGMLNFHQPCIHFVGIVWEYEMYFVWFELHCSFRFCGVVVITSALHAEGREFEPRQNLGFWPCSEN